MTARRDPDRLIRTYLEDGPTELADRSYDAVRYQIDHIRQRTVFGPWREPQVSKYLTFAIAAAAVLVVAVVGIGLFSGQGGGIGGPGPTATIDPTASPISTPAAGTPAPTASSDPAPSPTEAAVALPISGEVAPGRYFRFEGIFGQENIRITFTMPAGWTADEGAFLYKDRDQAGEVMFVTWLVTHVFSDACQWANTRTLVEVDTVDELVAALADQKGRDASAPTETTLAGLPATRMDLTVPADFDTSTCTNGNLRYWPDPGPDLSGGLCCNAPGNTDVLYIVDVDGDPMVVVARHYPESSPENRAELQAIVDSIRIEP